MWFFVILVGIFGVLWAGMIASIAPDGKESGRWFTIIIGLGPPALVLAGLFWINSTT